MKDAQRGFKKLVCCLVVIFILTLLGSSCVSKPENSIVGKWSLGTETVEFSKDGTFTMTDEEKHTSNGGNYRFIDKDTISLEAGGAVASAFPTAIKVTISGNEMTFTLPGGKPLTYKRVK